MAFTIDDIKADVGKIKNKILSSAYGLRQVALATYTDDILKDINIEGYYQNHANWNKLYDNGWEEYLLDVVNTDEGKKGDDKLKTEYETYQKGSFYNAFAMVVSQRVYALLDTLQKEKKPDWEKKSNEVWEAYNNIRSNINDAGAANTYGDNVSKDADKDNNLRSWRVAYDDASDKTKGKFQVKDYGLSLLDAVAQMKTWGEVKATTTNPFNLANETNKLDTDINARLDKYASGATKQTIIEALNKQGEKDTKFKETDGWKDWVGKSANENEFNDRKKYVVSTLSTIYIDYYLKMVDDEPDNNTLKGAVLKKLDGYKNDYADVESQQPFNEPTKKGKIEAIKKAVKEFGGFPLGLGLPVSGLSPTFGSGQARFNSLTKRGEKEIKPEINTFQQRAEENK